MTGWPLSVTSVVRALAASTLAVPAGATASVAVKLSPELRSRESVLASAFAAKASAGSALIVAASACSTCATPSLAAAV